MLGVFALLGTAMGVAQEEPPTENRYDVLGKALAPFVDILLADGQSKNRAFLMELKVVETSGRLPEQFKGATMTAAVESPDKVRLDAPVMGERVTVCRNGDEVWAIPGEKIEFLLSKFKLLPEPTKKGKTPLTIPVTRQQAVFLPALFSLEEGGTEEVEGVKCRMLGGGLMPDLARSVKAEDFRAKMWVAANYLPRQIEVQRKDFTMTVAIPMLKFGPALSAQTWQVPSGAKDVYRCTADELERVLYVVMNSLQMKPEDAPWLNER